MTGPWPRRDRVVATSRGHRWYLTVSRPPIRATEQPRKHTRAHAHTRPRYRSLALYRYGPRFGRTAAVTTTIIIYYRVLFYRLAAAPRRRTRLRSRLRSSARSARVYSLAPGPVAAAAAATHPWALPSGKLLST